MLVFLTEESSMSPVLRRVMVELWPDAHEGLDWQIIAHQGKADLEANLERKMRAWNYNTPHFIILRDNDGGDCRALKARLLQRASTSGKPHHVRIVCQELEAWFLGDLAAIEAAYPASLATAQQNRGPFRAPDNPPNAAQLTTQRTGTAAKVGRAALIAPHLDLDANASPSFNLLLSTLRALIPAHS